ncbi:hypothetical protein HPP92_024765 [Vanilla planifolia]|uniref:Protein kinase domain-containing protein n=1 Tax=Vanilla planifolia TaxID=51239 RepID=A0A835UBP1_VANPL|nr:hypothetical protein HPP92_024765 [Vanilla planifolia]
MAQPLDVILMALVDIFGRGWIKVQPVAHRSSAVPCPSRRCLHLPPAFMLVLEEEEEEEERELETKNELVFVQGEPPIVKTIKKHKISSPSEKARTNRSLEDKKPIEQRLKENKSSEDKKSAEEELKKEKDALENGFGGIGVQTFTIHELAMATNNFRNDRLLGLGGFGRVYKGKLDNFNQFVAVKQLNRNGFQGNREFLVEVLMLSLLRHPNLVKLLGYCADGNQRLLVYEYMPLGSLNDHLHDPNSDTERLDWNTRMSIAAGTAKGLQHLHDKANPPVIYRDLKCSNILLGEGYYPKLSDFGLAKLAPMGDDTHVSTRVMGTYGYCAPEYVKTGQLTLKSDVYSFGVVLLEILSGRQAFDNSRAAAEQNLVAWARPLLKDRRAFFNWLIQH